MKVTRKETKTGNHLSEDGELPGTIQLAPNNQRQYPRIAYRTIVRIVEASSHIELEQVVGWTCDISPAGAFLLTQGPLSGSKLYLKMLLPRFEKSVFEAKVVREACPSPEWCGGREDLYGYGIEFIRLFETPESLPSPLSDLLRDNGSTGKKSRSDD